jgi:uncharacterized FlgJ-related protein
MNKVIRDIQKATRHKREHILNVLIIVILAVSIFPATIVEAYNNMTYQGEDINTIAQDDTLSKYGDYVDSIEILESMELTKSENTVDVVKQSFDNKLVASVAEEQQTIIDNETARLAEGERQRQLEEERRIEEERLAQIASITSNPDDVTQISNMTLEQMAMATEGTWWEGNEQALYDLEQNYHINAFYAMAVSTLESGNGTSERANSRANYYGIESGKHYNTLYECTMYFGDFQNRLYINDDDHLISVWTIGPKYCPPNRKWEVYMANKMNELYNKVIETVN